MKTTTAFLVLSLAIPVAAAAQAPAQPATQAQTVRHSFFTAHKTKLSVDFGAKKALKSLPQPQVRCESVRKHTHELSPAAKGFIELPVYGGHGLRRPVTPCAMR
jgi:hypothetical protein